MMFLLDPQKEVEFVLVPLHIRLVQMKQKVARGIFSAARRFDFLTEQSFHGAESLLSCLFRCVLIRSSHAGYNVSLLTEGLKRDMSFTVTGA